MFSGCSSMEKLNLNGFRPGTTKDTVLKAIPDSLKELSFDGFNAESLQSMAELFAGKSSLESVSMKNCKMQYVKDMSSMFENCTSLKSLAMEGISTQKVTNMSNLFRNCSSLTEVDLGNFRTPNVTTMQGMFSGCSSLASLDLSEFYTGASGSKLENAADIFAGCTSMEKLNLNGFRPGTTKDAVLRGIPDSLKELSFDEFNALSLESMQGLFSGRTSLESVSMKNCKMQYVKNMSRMFFNCTGLKSLNMEGINTQNVTDMSYLFYYCSNLESLDITGFSTAKVKDMTQMFYGLSAVKELDLSRLDTRNTIVRDLFSLNFALEKITIGSDFIWNVAGPVNNAADFPRGMWKREADQETFTSMDLTEMLLSAAAPGTYVKTQKYSISPDLEDITYKIGRLDEFDCEISADGEASFRVENGRVYAWYAPADDGGSIEYVLPGSIELIFRDVVTDADDNTYDLRITLSSFRRNTFGSSLPAQWEHVADTVWTPGTFCLRSETGTGFRNVTVGMKITDSDGNAVDGRFIFSTNDLDIATLHKDNATDVAYYNGWFNSYSEGINLISGYSSVITADRSSLLDMGENELWDGYRYTGKRFSSTGEASDLLLSADAEGFVYQFTADASVTGPNTSFMNEYQPIAVKFRKVNEAGDRVAGAVLVISDADGGTEASGARRWTSSASADKGFFLKPGTWRLHEEGVPEGMIGSGDILFEVDNDGNIRLSGDTGRLEDRTILITNTRETYTVTYKDGVDGSVFTDQMTDGLYYNDKTPDFEGEHKREGFVFTGWDPEVAELVTGNAVYTAAWKEAEASYTVEFYYQKEGKYPEVCAFSEERACRPGDLVSITDGDRIPDPSKGDHYVFDEDYTGNVLSGTVKGHGETVLKVFFKECFTIIYDYNGGKIGKLTGHSEKWGYGDVIKISPQPEREGFTFLYWKGSEYMPGDDYRVTEDHLFTAQWKEPEETTPEETTPEETTPEETTPEETVPEETTAEETTAEETTAEETTAEETTAEETTEEETTEEETTIEETTTATPESTESPDDPPGTGDDFSLLFWGGLFAGAALLVILLLFFIRRGSKK